MSDFRCSVCGGESFERCDYMSRTASCPALECAMCRAITLDEDVAASAVERESVREMVAVRARIHADAERAARARVAGVTM